MSTTVWSYLASLLAAAPKKLTVALVLMACLTMTEGAGLLLLVPLLQLIGLDVHEGNVGRIAELVASFYASIHLRPSLPVVLTTYLLIIGARALLLRWQTVTLTALHSDYAALLRKRLYRAIMNSRWLFFARRRASDLMHGLTAEIDRAASVTQSILSLAVDLLVGAAYLILAFHLSQMVTGLVLLCGAGLWLLLRDQTQAAGSTGQELSLASSQLYGASIEHLAAIKTTKSYGAQERNLDIFSRLTERVADAYVNLSRCHANLKVWSDVGAAVLLCLTLLLLIEIQGESAAAIFLLVFVFFRLIPRFTSIRYAYQTVVSMLPAYHTVAELLAECERAAESAVARRELMKLRKGVRFERVTFAYERVGPPVIHGVDLFIPAGTTTVIVGPSGAGKSTIADLVMGLVVADSGYVLVDGVSLDGDRIRSWRDQIGYVAQDTFLFHDTVRANLLWACPNASESDIWIALRQSAAADFVALLPSGLETVIGDRGIRLSGGERQRLALARALLRKPSLLILDEATNNLDPENELQIQNAIAELQGRTTILLITHRLSTARGADLIYVLERGQVVESGSLDSLLANVDGRFATLFNAPALDFALERAEVTASMTVPTPRQQP